MADFDIPEGAEERCRRLDAAEADHVAAVEKRRAASKAVKSLVKAYAEAEAVLHAARAEEDAAFDRYRAIAEVTPWYMSSSARGLLGSVGPSAEGDRAKQGATRYWCPACETEIGNQGSDHSEACTFSEEI